jgi:P27 family predicted phage terminase small subunit
MVLDVFERRPVSDLCRQCCLLKIRTPNGLGLNESSPIRDSTKLQEHHVIKRSETISGPECQPNERIEGLNMTRRKSIEDHKLSGTYRADRHDRKSPQFAPGATAPKYLSKVAKAEWRRIAPLLKEAGILQAVDTTILAAYCVNYSGWLEAMALIKEKGMVILVESQTRTGRTSKPAANPGVALMHAYEKAMLASAAKLGLNPSDRSRVQVPHDPAERSSNNNDPLNTDIDDFEMPEVSD